MKIKFAIAFLLAIVSLPVSLTGFSQAYISQGNVTSGAFGVVVPPPSFVRSGTNSGTTATSYSLTNFNCSGGNMLVVGISTQSGSITVSSITANGVGMSLVYSTNYNSTGKVHMYSLPNPTTGDVALTLSGNPSSSQLCAMLFSGAGSINSGKADFSSASTRTGTTNTITTGTSDLVVDLFAIFVSAQVPTVSAGQTVRVRKNTSNAANLSGGTSPGSAGTTTMGWQSSAAQTCTWVGAVLHQ